MEAWNIIDVILKESIIIMEPISDDPLEEVYSYGLDSEEEVEEVNWNTVPF